MSGAAPQGARSEREAAAWVRGMFGRVAPRYDLANHLLSFNIDKLWRARTVRRVAPVLNQPGALALDICCGTGDLLLALQKASRGRVLGSDFCHPMLLAAHRKAVRGSVAGAVPAVARQAFAAALALGGNTNPRDIAVEKLQQQLQQQGAFIGRDQDVPEGI